MSFASRYNKGSIDWAIPSLDNFKYMKLEEAFKTYKPETVYTVNGLYINRKGKYDDHGIVIDAADSICLDLPAHMTDTIIEILKDPDAIADIKAGKVGVVIYTYEDSNKNLRYSAKWVDVLEK